VKHASPSVPILTWGYASVHHQDINVNSHAADISLANMLPPQCFYDAAHTANVSDHLQLPHLRSHDLQPLISQPSFCWGEDVASQDDVAAFLSEESLPIDFTAAALTFFCKHAATAMCYL
jgi:hypothetical protein